MGYGGFLWSMSMKIALFFATTCLSSLTFASWPTVFDSDAHRVDIGYASAVDSKGNLYLFGSTMKSNTNQDLLLVKLNANGKVVYSKSYGKADVQDLPRGIAVDDADGVYLLASNQANGRHQIQTIKYSETGDFRWINTIETPSGMIASPQTIKAVPDGGVVVLGNEDHNGSGVEIVTVRYRASGSLQWKRTVNQDAQQVSGMTLAVDANKNVAVCGSVPGTHNTDIGVFVYSGDGDLKWSQSENGSADMDDYPVSTTFDHSGSLVVTGTSRQSNGQANVLTAKYSADGERMWRTTNGTEDASEFPEMVTVDAQDNVVIAGSKALAGGSVDLFVNKLAADGTHLWTRSYKGDGSTANIATGVVVDGSGNVYLGGTYEDSISKRHSLVVIQYSAEGVRHYVRLYTPDKNKDAYATSIVWDASHEKGFISGYGNFTTDTQGIAESDLFAARF